LRQKIKRLTDKEKKPGLTKAEEKKLANYRKVLGITRPTGRKKASKRKVTRKKAKKKKADEPEDSSRDKRFYRINKAFLMKIKKIFLNSSNVYEEIERLFNKSDLSKLFPAMADLKDRPKFGPLNVYDHTLLMIKLTECIEKDDVAGFSEGKGGWNINTKAGRKLFQKYVSMFSDLTQNGKDKKMRMFIYFVVLFHDIGEVKHKQKHHIFSAKWVTKRMGLIGFSKGEVEKARRIIAAHVDLGTLFVSGRSPEYLQSDHSLGIAGMDEGKKLQYLKLITLLTMVDVRSFNEGKFVDKSLMAFYPRIVEEGYLDKLADKFFDYRVRMFCSTPAHTFLPDKYAQAQAALKELEGFLGDEYKNFEESIRERIWVFNYIDYFLWGFQRGESLIKMFALFYVLTRNNKIRWAEIKIDSGAAIMMGSLVEEHILQKVSLKDIVTPGLRQLRDNLKRRHVKIWYTTREGYGKIVRLRFDIWERVNLEAALTGMLQESLPYKQAPPITAKRDNQTLKVTLSGSLRKAVRTHPRTATMMLRANRLELTLITPQGRQLPILPKRVKEITFDSIHLTVDLTGIKKENYDRLKVTFSVPHKDKEKPAKVYEGTVNITYAAKKPGKDKGSKPIGLTPVSLLAVLSLGSLILFVLASAGIGSGWLSFVSTHQEIFWPISVASAVFTAGIVVSAAPATINLFGAKHYLLSSQPRVTRGGKHTLILYVTSPLCYGFGTVRTGKVIVQCQNISHFVREQAIGPSLEGSTPQLWQHNRDEHMNILRQELAEFIRKTMSGYDIDSIDEMTREVTVTHECEHIDQEKGIVSPAIERLLKEIMHSLYPFARERGLPERYVAAVSCELGARLAGYGVFPELQLLKDLRDILPFPRSPGARASALLIRHITGVDFTKSTTPYDKEAVEEITAYIKRLLEEERKTSGYISSTLKEAAQRAEEVFFKDIRPSAVPVDKDFYDSAGPFNKPHISRNSDKTLALLGSSVASLKALLFNRSKGSSTAGASPAASRAVSEPLKLSDTRACERAIENEGLLFRGLEVASLERGRKALRSQPIQARGALVSFTGKGQSAKGKERQGQMGRRDFLGLAGKAAAVAVAPSVLSSCADTAQRPRSGLEHQARRFSSSRPQDLSVNIRQLVKKFNYYDSVGQDFVEWVYGWKDSRTSLPAVVAWKQQLDRVKIQLSQAKRDEERKKAEIKLIGTEANIIEDIARRLRKDINKGPEGVSFDLARIMERREADNLGYVQLLYFIAKPVGLDVRTIALSEDYLVNLVFLRGNTVMYVDVTMEGPGKIFNLKKEYKYVRAGKYWKRKKERDDTLGFIPEIFRELPENKMRAEIYTSIGFVLGSQAMRFNKIYNSMTIVDQRKFNSAIWSFQEALRNDKECAEAHRGLAVMYSELSKGSFGYRLGEQAKDNLRKAKAYYLEYQRLSNKLWDNDHALALQYFGLGKAHELLVQFGNWHVVQAYNYYNRAAVLNPSLKEAFRSMERLMPYLPPTYLSGSKKHKRTLRDKLDRRINKYGGKVVDKIEEATEDEIDVVELIKSAGSSSILPLIGLAFLGAAALLTSERGQHQYTAGIISSNWELAGVVVLLAILAGLSKLAEILPSYSYTGKRKLRNRAEAYCPADRADKQVIKVTATRVEPQAQESGNPGSILNVLMTLAIVFFLGGVAQAAAMSAQVSQQPINHLSPQVCIGFSIAVEIIALAFLALVVCPKPTEKITMADAGGKWYRGIQEFLRRSISGPVIPKPEDHGLRPWMNGRSGRRPTGVSSIGTTGFTRGAPVTRLLTTISITRFLPQMEMSLYLSIDMPRESPSRG